MRVNLPRHSALRRRLGLGAALTVAASGGLYAYALPTASADTAPTIAAYAIPGSGSDDAIAIAPAAAGAQDEWVIDSPLADDGDGLAPDGDPRLYSLPAAGGAASVISNSDIQGGGAYANAEAGGAGALVNDGATDYVTSLEGVLFGLAAGGTASATTTTLADFEQGALVVGPDGNFYNGDSGAGLNAILMSGDDETLTSYPLPDSYALFEDEGGPAALVSDDTNNLIWFVTQLGQLGSFSPSTQTFSAPYSVTDQSGNSVSLSGLAGTLAVSGDTLYASTDGDGIAAINPSNPTSATIYPAPDQQDAEINGLTVGPDGNIWFADAGTNEIGELNVTTGTLAEYPLPTGVMLPEFEFDNSTTIASGPTGSSTVFFQALEGSGAAVGVLTIPAPDTDTGGDTPPAGDGGGGGGSDTTPTTPATTPSTSSTPTTSSTPSTSSMPSTSTSLPTTPSTSTTPTVMPPAASAAKLKLAATAAVSAKGVAAVKLTCSGAACSGKLALTITEKQKVKGKTERITVTLGSAKYSVAKGKSATVEVKLIKAGLKDVQAAKHHKLAVTAALKPAKGSKSAVKLTLVGSKK